jgi:glycosyltransferase involved in cell wall biosynthesis
MIVHAYYDEDPRVRREAEALVASGRPVDVIALRRPDDSAAADVQGVTVRRLPVRRHQGAGLATYLREYLTFLVRAGAVLTAAHARRRYALVQVHSLPDFLVFAGLPLKVRGVPLVLDLHEAMPEFFRSRFPQVRSRLAHRLVGLQERLSIRLADAVITATQPFVDRLVRLGVPPEKVTLVHNSPDLARFDPRAYPVRRFMEGGVLRLVYAGALTPTYELDVVLDGVALLRARRPDLAVELDIYGRGDDRDRLERHAERLGLGGPVRFHDRVPLEEVPALIAASDVGLAPTRRDRFTDMTLSTKVFEAAAMGKPVLASGIRSVRSYFPEGTVAVYEPGNGGAFADVLASLVDDPNGRAARVTRTAERIRELAWDGEAERYVALIDRLTGNRIGSYGLLARREALAATQKEA